MYLEESDAKGDACDDPQVGLHHSGHQGEAALRSSSSVGEKLIKK